MRKTLAFAVFCVLLYNIDGNAQTRWRWDSTLVISPAGDTTMTYGYIQNDSTLKKTSQQVAPISLPPSHISIIKQKAEAKSWARKRQVSVNRTSSNSIVGEIPFTETVLPNGSMQVSIPVETVKSFAPAPQISLVYNSLTGNSDAGYGWSIGGLSCIRATSKSIYYDGETSHAILGPQGAFILDGVRLIPNNNTSMSGFDYVTASGYIYVKKVLRAGKLAAFEVAYPDGSRATFGYIDQTTERIEYPITSVIYRNGFRIDYTYSLSGNRYYVSQIKYGGKNVSSHPSVISFSYSSRYDIPNGYYAGLMTTNTKILSSIESKEGNERIINYSFTYTQHNGVNTLTQLNCSTSSGVLNPLVFSYGISGQSDTFDSNVSSIAMGTDVGDGNEPITGTGHLLLGKGEMGAVFAPGYSTYTTVASHQKPWFGHWCLKFGSPYPNDELIPVLPSFNNPSNILYINADSGFQDIACVDVDGDGKDEIVKINFGSNSETNVNLLVSVYDCEESSLNQRYSIPVEVGGIINSHNYYWSPTSRTYLFADFNGNGKTDLLTVSHRKNFHNLESDATCEFNLINLQTGSLSGTSQPFIIDKSDETNLFLVDYDGDGAVELCHVTSNALNFYSFVGGTTSSTKYSKQTSENLTSYQHYLGDVNGDGITDLVFAGSSKWYYFWGTGTGYIEEISTSNPFSVGSSTKMVLLDVDKNGQSDIVRIDGSSIKVYLTTAHNRFSNSVSTSTSCNSNARIIGFNTVQNRQTSIVTTLVDNILYGYRFKMDRRFDRLLSRTTDSYGNNRRYLYYDMPEPDLSSNAYYPTNSAYSYPYAQKCFSIPILGSRLIFEPTNSSIILEKDYHYSGAVIHQTGMGFCGFTQLSESDNIRRVIKQNTYFPEKQGALKEEILSVPGDTLSYYQKTVYTYTITENGAKRDLFTKSINAENKLDGTTTSITRNRGAYDLPTSETRIDKRIGESSGITFTTSWSRANRVSADYYLLGLIVNEVQVSYNRAVGQIPSMDRWQTTFDENDYPTTIIRHTGTVSSQNLLSTSNCSFDEHGHILSESNCPYNVTSPTTTTYTYSADGRYLLSKDDGDGHTISFPSYNKYGKPNYSIDQDGRRTDWTYDDLGRQIGETLPDGSTTNHVYAWENDASFSIEYQSNVSPTEQSWYNSVGQIIKHGQKRFDGQWQYTDYQYWDNGLLKKSSKPYRTGLPTLWNSIEYDKYHRKTKELSFSGNEKRWTYDGLTISETSDGITISRTYNAAGDLISSSDPGGTVTFNYNNSGKLTRVAAPDNVITSFSFDKYGRQYQITDPSAGVQKDSTSYYADGSMVRTIRNANGWISKSYNKHGQLLSENSSGNLIKTYSYDANNRLSSVSMSNGTLQSYTYDNLDRIASYRETSNSGFWFETSYSYNSSGLLSAKSFSTSNGTIATENYSYQNGSLVSTALANGALVNEIIAENDFGLATQSHTGLVTRNYSYDASGLTTSRSMGSVQNLSYSYNSTTGNMVSRHDVTRSKSEFFGYDNLNRFVHANGNVTSYSSNGNITNRGGLGSFEYGDSAHPYRITGRAFSSSTYLPDQEQTISYNEYLKPTQIEVGDSRTEFVYGPNGNRFRMIQSQNDTLLLDRQYFGGCYERDITIDGIKEKLYLGGDYYDAPMVYVRVNNGAWTLYNIGRDHLGSITHIATTDGTLIAEYSYDAWGNMRNPSTWTLYQEGSEPTLILGRGYTGHEHLQDCGLINMNARLYDPQVGRFLSPDPYIQAPDFTQSYNRYSYALNNPLKYTDKSGEILGIDDALFWGIVAGSAIGAYTGGLLANNGQYNPCNWNFNSPTTWGYMLGGAIFGGISAYAGASIAASGIPMANTASIMYSSLLNSIGTAFYTGGKTPVSMSFGFASYDFTNGKWGYLGKEENSILENIGYALGLTSNLKDINDLFDSTTARLYTQITETDLQGNQHFDYISHSGIAEGNEHIFLSYGPNGDYKSKGTPTSLIEFAFRVRKGTADYPVPFKYSISSPAFQINERLFTLVHKVANSIPYQGITSNCVNWASLALWLNGIPNIGIHPFILHSSVYLYNTGLYNYTSYALQFYY